MQVTQVIDHRFGGTFKLSDRVTLHDSLGILGRCYVRPTCACRRHLAEGLRECQVEEVRGVGICDVVDGLLDSCQFV